MELKDFIDKTIYEICMGISSASARVNSEMGNYPVAPAFINGKPVFDKMENIEFDICVTVSKNKGKGNSGGANIKIFAINVNKNEEVKSETVNRIKFAVPFSPGALRKS